MATQPVTFELGGKPRRLKYTLYALGQIGERLGIKVRLDSIMDDLVATELPLSALAVVVWAGLIHEDEELTVEQVGKWIDQDNMREVVNAFFGLFGARLPETTRKQVERQLGIAAEEVPETTTTTTTG